MIKVEIWLGKKDLAEIKRLVKIGKYNSVYQFMKVHVKKALAEEKD